MARPRAGYTVIELEQAGKLQRHHEPNPELPALQSRNRDARAEAPGLLAELPDMSGVWRQIQRGSGYENQAGAVHRHLADVIGIYRLPVFRRRLVDGTGRGQLRGIGLVDLVG